jgi:hypothetical protein
MIRNSFARTCRVHGGFHVSKKIAAEMSIVFIKVDSTAASRMLRSVMIRPKSILDQAVGLRRVRQTGIVLHAGRYPLLEFLGTSTAGKGRGIIGARYFRHDFIRTEPLNVVRLSRSRNCQEFWKPIHAITSETKRRCIAYQSK